MAETPTIWVTVEAEDTVTTGPLEGQRDGRQDVGGAYGRVPVPEALKQMIRRKRVPLDAALLQQQMGGLLAVIGDLFEQAAHHPQMQLQELELAVEINGEGQVSLVGNGAKITNKGGITMKFTAKS